MSSGPLLRPQPRQGAKPVGTRGTSTGQQKRRHVIICLGVAAVILSAVVAAGFSKLIGQDPSPTGDPAATASATNRYGTIVKYDGGNQCQHTTFDNNTGRYSEVTASCEGHVIRDANGVPMPQGTMNVMNSISKSFK